MQLKCAEDRTHDVTSLSTGQRVEEPFLQVGGAELGTRPMRSGCTYTFVFVLRLFIIDIDGGAVGVW